MKNEWYRFYAQSAFTGHKVRFLSERQLIAGEYGKVRQLFVIGSANVSQAAADALAKFPGKVIADRHSLRFNVCAQQAPWVKENIGDRVLKRLEQERYHV